MAGNSPAFPECGRGGLRSEKLRRLRRIVVVVLATLGTIFIGLQWVAPVVLSIETAREPPRYARLVPVELRDSTISQAPGRKLTYFGYEFEIPWNDLDETKTKLSRDGVVLTFHSGLQVMVGILPAKFWVNGLASGWHASAASLELTFGAETMRSDYNFIKMLYEFTPEQMHRWALSPRVHYRESMLLTFKSAALLPPVEKGFFNIHNQSYKGFQQGDPTNTQLINANLYSDEGSISFAIFRSDHRNLVGVSQAEINRIVQSLRKPAAGESVVSTAAVR